MRLDSAQPTQVLEAYDLGRTTLSNIHKDSNITPETVDEKLDALRDILADQEEFDQVIKESGELSGLRIDEEELEAELRKLEERDEEWNRGKEKKEQERAKAKEKKVEKVNDIDKDLEQIIEELDALSVPSQPLEVEDRITNSRVNTEKLTRLPAF